MKDKHQDPKFEPNIRLPVSDNGYLSVTPFQGALNCAGGKQVTTWHSGNSHDAIRHLRADPHNTNGQDSIQGIPSKVEFGDASELVTGGLSNPQ
ncbi:hypothetical protein CVT25_014144 [Psilocybe cyanescens]|uniref:Uncharacterized protein n=1 Tax=Psilocybe cyanescens TaxID=93625 RepID=A0A409XG34_PSICY|nr:hypothetical protein CVT25_014144 [Psilocybe cyanescens]